MDLTESIAPRSDQWNADDLIAGPVTVTIAEVVKGKAERPWDFQLVETPGRAYRPSKTMLRVIVVAWGPDSSTYAGRRLTLYREPTIRFGKELVGGIRISHMSHIEQVVTMQAQTSRGHRETFVVEPLPDSTPDPRQDRTPPLVEAFEAAGLSSTQSRLDYCSARLKRNVTSARELTPEDTERVLAALAADASEVPS